METLRTNLKPYTPNTTSYMNSITRKSLAIALLWTALALPTHAALLQFTASIDAAQETTGSDSTATGTAVLIYDTADNTFDLTVTINDFSNTLIASHVHEGAPGVAGGVVTGLGDESLYTRDGNTLTGTFLNLTYGGDPATLLAGGAYLNYHTAAWAGGEIRGQLIPDPIKLTALIDASQETGTVTSDAYGAAQATYDPVTNEIDLLVFVYNFTNTLTNSHFHEAAVGVSGGVVTGLGAAAVYQQFGNTYTQQFDNLTYGGDPLALVSGGAYLNFHSDVYAPGEIRGQLWVSDGTSSSELKAVSSRGQVNTGEGVLITGFIITGTEPLRLAVTARGPVLTPFGVVDALADPVLAINDSNEVVLMANDNSSDGAYPALVTGAGISTTATEAATIMILPPGAYTSVMSGAGTSSGIGLAEAFKVAW